MFHLSCLACGGPVQHRADGTSSGALTQAIADCTACGWEFVIAVHMQAITKRPVAAPRCSPTKEIAHGTDRGYAQHRSQGLPIDAEDSCGCRAAHAAHHRAYKQERRR